MMLTPELGISNDFKVEVATTQNRGFTPEEIAPRCADRIISISDNASPVLQQQAYAFKNEMERVIADYMRQAISSDRTTVYNTLLEAGNPELAELIRRL